jgi:hypothetical protein
MPHPIEAAQPFEEPSDISHPAVISARLSPALTMALDG